jgi:hypothetical protein
MLERIMDSVSNDTLLELLHTHTSSCISKRWFHPAVECINTSSEKRKHSPDGVTIVRKFNLSQSHYSTRTIPCSTRRFSSPETLGHLRQTYITAITLTFGQKEDINGIYSGFW